MNSTFYLLRPFISLSVLPNEALKTKNIFLDCANVVVRSVIVSLCLCYFSSIAQAKDLTLDDLYNNFNIRSIYSSFGPRLKYYCENYLSDYFPEPVMISESEMILDDGDDVWQVEIIGSNTISITNDIRTGTYLSVEEYAVYFDETGGDWKSDETYIDQSSDCIKYSDR